MGNCFSSESKQSSKEAEAQIRHARIVNLYHESDNNSQHCSPPAYNEISTTPRIMISNNRSSGLGNGDEKDSSQVEPQPSERSPASSPRTSIISIPSTRLTGLTASHTGATSTTVTVVADDDLSRLSFSQFDSAPPSYYAGSTYYASSQRSRSRSPDITNRTTDEHPVMAADWFERLQADARRREQ